MNQTRLKQEEYVTDSPNVPGGNIVGGDHVTARGYYGGKGQTLLYSGDYEDVVGRVANEIREVVAAWGANANRKFPDNRLWEIRVWG